MRQEERVRQGPGASAGEGRGDLLPTPKEDGEGRSIIVGPWQSERAKGARSISWGRGMEGRGERRKRKGPVLGEATGVVYPGAVGEGGPGNLTRW